MPCRYQIIYWRDVPMQIRAKCGRQRASRMFAERFQKTVYRAAYRAKAITGEAYQNGFRRSDWIDIDNDKLDSILDNVIAEVETSYDDARLNRLALSKGVDVKSDADVEERK